MSDETKIVRDRQKAIRREMNRRGIAVKAVQFDGGWETSSTVLSYFPGDEHKEPAVMSVASLYRLLETNALPLDLLSLVLPAGLQIVRVSEGVDHDTLASLAADYVATKNIAHHPDSEAGREIGPKEDAVLTDKACRLVRSVAA